MRSLHRKSARIELAGGIASGKSTLVSALAHQRVETVFENFAANPFFDLFYAKPDRYAFETEVTYMLQHYSSIADAVDREQKFVAADFSMALDLAYARVTLGADDLDVFERVFDHVLAKIGRPDLLVKLDCSSKVELARIQARARPAEQSITIGYLDRLNESVEAVLRDNRFLGQAVLRIDSAELDFRPEGKDRDDVVSRILLGATP
jgi:deoxyguanosine kinase